MCELEFTLLGETAIIEIDYRVDYDDDYGIYAWDAMPTHLNGVKLTDEQAESVLWLAGPDWIDMAANDDIRARNYGARYVA